MLTIKQKICSLRMRPDDNMSVSVEQVSGRQVTVIAASLRVLQTQHCQPTWCWGSAAFVLRATANFYFHFLLAAVIICIVGENKENKVHEYVPVNWILSVQAELGTQASGLPAWNNDGVCVEEPPPLALLPPSAPPPLKQLINSRESLSPRVRSDKSSASPSVINMSLTTSSIIWHCP